MSTILADDVLMNALYGMQIEPDGASLTFLDRLAVENGWSHAFAERVYSEYCRFLYLAATTQSAVTPSDEVDQAWHLHLTYSRHYWDVLCGVILKRPLHHGPTKGGATEGEKYHAQYEATRQSYAKTFGSPPPVDIWPDSNRRFGARYQRIEMGRHWMVPKQLAYALAPLPLLAGCTGKPVLAGIVIVLMVGLIALAFIFTRALSAHPQTSSKKKGDGSGCGAAVTCTNSDSGGDSGCGGGCGGCS